MDRLDHLLVITAEECSEVAKNISKALRFGLKDCEPGTTVPNSRLIEEELRDLLEMAQMLEDEGAITGHWKLDKPDKRAKVELFLGYSSDRGRLT